MWIKWTKNTWYFFLVYGFWNEKQIAQQRSEGILTLRHREECQEVGQKEEKWPVRLWDGHRRWRDGTLPPGPVAERRVAAGDADWVQPASTELLVAGGGDEASPGGGTGFPIMYSCNKTNRIFWIFKPIQTENIQLLACHPALRCRACCKFSLAVN